nr:MliC family protein [uncultured Roseateles sp.]
MRLCSLKTAALLGITGLLLTTTGAARAQAGVANCAKVKPGSLDAWLCKDESLMALDKKMAETLSAAEPIAAKEKPPMLKAEQRGWGTKSRDECLKSGDAPACLKLSYQRRIAELQASYALMAPTAKANYQCGSKPEDVVKTATYATEPPTMLAEYDETTSVLYLKPSAMGSSYAGDQVSFFELDGQVKIVWGPGSPEWKCKRE